MVSLLAGGVRRSLPHPENLPASLPECRSTPRRYPRRMRGATRQRPIRSIRGRPRRSCYRSRYAQNRKASYAPMVAPHMGEGRVQTDVRLSFPPEGGDFFSARENHIILCSQGIDTFPTSRLANRHDHIVITPLIAGICFLTDHTPL